MPKQTLNDQLASCIIAVYLVAAHFHSKKGPKCTCYSSQMIFVIIFTVSILWLRVN